MKQEAVRWNKMKKCWIYDRNCHKRKNRGLLKRRNQAGALLSKIISPPRLVSFSGLQKRETRGGGTKALGNIRIKNSCSPQPRSVINPNHQPVSASEPTSPGPHAPTQPGKPTAPPRQVRQSLPNSPTFSRKVS